MKASVTTLATWFDDINSWRPAHRSAGLRVYFDILK